MLRFSLLLGVTLISAVVCELVVGFLLGFGLIAKLLPGDGSAGQKGLSLQHKLARWQVPLGLVALATALLLILYRLHILSPI
jgi:hypothetical protein